MDSGRAAGARAQVVGPGVDVGFLREGRAVEADPSIEDRNRHIPQVPSGSGGVLPVVQGDPGRPSYGAVARTRPSTTRVDWDAEFVGDHILSALVPAEVGQTGPVGGARSLRRTAACAGRSARRPGRYREAIQPADRVRPPLMRSKC